jgi:hypothetical protein
MSVIDDIEAINEKLSDWIVNTTPDPSDAASVQDMKQVIDLHNQLDQLLTKLRLADLQSQNNALAAVIAKQGPQLSSLSTRIAAVANNIKTVESVISYAAQAIAAVTQIVSFAAAA